MMYDIEMTVMVTAAGVTTLAMVYLWSRDPLAAASGPGICSISYSVAKPLAAILHAQPGGFPSTGSPLERGHYLDRVSTGPDRCRASE